MGCLDVILFHYNYYSMYSFSKLLFCVLMACPSSALFSNLTFRGRTGLSSMKQQSSGASLATRESLRVTRCIPRTRALSPVSAAS